MNEIEAIKQQFWQLLNEHQELIVKELLSNQLFAKHFNSFELMWSAENELMICRIGNNSERAILIGQDKDDICFVGYAGKPVKRTFIHLDHEGVTIVDIVNYFLFNLE